MPMLSPPDLRTTGRGILVALGTPEDIAEVVAGSLVAAQLVGHDSHGLIRLTEYAEFVRSGKVQPAARPVVTRQGSTAVVDGQWGWGQLACALAVSTARALVATNGAAAVTISHCNHIGRIGEYVEEVAADGLIGIAWCNAEPAVAPFGGMRRLLGTNPFAAGIPLAPGKPPAVVDFATAAVAEGKLRVARATGSPIPSDVVIDRLGRPVDNPDAFYEGGALLPFGGHKGYGLSVMIEMLGGALSGNHPSTSPEYTSGNGAVLIVLDPAFFVGGDAFAVDTETCAEALRNSPATAGSVLVPGDVENQVREQRSERVPVAEEIWAQLKGLAAQLGVPADHKA